MKHSNQMTLLEHLPFDQTIDFPINLWLTQVDGLQQIPANCILYKSIPGIGATYSEILARRHSIIMLPHVSIIRNKHEKYKEKHGTLAIYGDKRTVSPKAIEEYLVSGREFRKILTTPAGLIKVIRAVERLSYRGVKIDLLKDYFLLIDEGHKWVKDVEYREDMIPPIENFFNFENKAIVSATMLPFSDPRFKEHGFKRIKLNPIFPIGGFKDCFRTEPFKRNLSAIDINSVRLKHPFKRDIKLYGVNSVTTALKDYIEANPAPAHCIFLNSIQGIESIIKDLGIEGESRIFCSKESSKVLKGKGKLYAISHEFLPGDRDKLMKFNFFTSSFYSGLDIDLCFKPNVIILTECKTLQFSIVDPYTDVIQIIGRFRNDMYKSVVHINDYTKYISQLPSIELQKKMEASKHFYYQLETLKDCTDDVYVRDFCTKAMVRSYPYSSLFSGGEFCHFKEDNYWNLKRIHSYYKEAYLLISAYRNSKLYNVTTDRAIYEGSDLIRFTRSKGKYNREHMTYFAEAYEELQVIRATLNYNVLGNNMFQLYPIWKEVMDRLGIKGLHKARFSHMRLKEDIILLDKEEGLNQAPLVELIYENFRLSQSYALVPAASKLQKLYDLVGINIKAQGSHLKRYFDTRPTTKQSSGALYLIDRKFKMNDKYIRP